MTVFTLIPLATLIFSVFIGGYIWAHQGKSKVNRAFLLYSFMASLYMAYDVVIWSNLGDLIVGSWHTKYLVIVWTFWGFFFLNFVYVFLGRRKDLFYYFSLLVPIVSYLINLRYGLIATGSHKYYWGYQILTGPMYPVAVFSSVFPLVFGIILLGLGLRKISNDKDKSNQYKLLIFGTLIPLLVGFLLSFIIPSIFDIHRMPRFVAEYNFIQLLCIYIAITRYRFLALSIEDVANDLFSNVTDGIVVLSSEERIIHYNEPVAQLFPGIATGKTGFEQFLLDYESSESYYENEFVVENDKSTSIISLSTSEILTDSGSKGKLIMIRDITKQKDAEAKLALTRKKLVEAARKAGMAEVATEVLHIVGNILNSVNSSASSLERVMNQSRITTLDKIVVLLEEHKENLSDFLENDSKGIQMVEFLRKLNDVVMKERAIALEEISNLRKHVTKIDQAISRQEAYTVSGPYEETMSLQSIIEEACQENQDIIDAHNIKIDVHNAYDFSLTLDRFKLINILSIVIDNAACALVESTLNQEKYVHIEVGVEDENIVLSVQDNGVGIDSKELESIFMTGYTTRGDKPGLGLHKASLIIKQLGGAIEAKSDGKDKGATFRICLPQTYCD